MLLRRAQLEAIRAGEIDLAFRRWERPQLHARTHMRTAIGLVEVTSVAPVASEDITASAAPPWTHATLTRIERHPETKAAEPAERTQRELLALEARRARAQELGPTESLDAGTGCRRVVAPCSR